MIIKKPEYWGVDNLTNYLDFAQENRYATYVKMRGEVGRLSKIDKLFSSANSLEMEIKHTIIRTLFLRSHAAFLVSCQCAMAGQFPDTFVNLRACLEAALYGLFIFSNPEHEETWLNRGKDTESKKQMRSVFTMTNISSKLKEKHPIIAKILSELYEQTIDLGAHPNQDSIMSIVKIKEDGDGVDLHYLSADELNIKLAIKSCARVGLTCLNLFEIVEKSKFKSAKLDEIVEELSKGM